MSNALYREEILDHYQHPRHFGKPKRFTHSYSLNNTHCGDDITVYLVLKKDQVTEIYYQAKGCAISIASASILSAKLAGKTRTQILKLSSQKILKLLQMELTPTRSKCALLAPIAIKRALLHF